MKPGEKEEHQGAAKAPDLPPGAVRIECETIRPLLFEYVAHELGGSRSELVHAHLMHCRHCREEASELKSTVTLLKEVPTKPSTKLDTKRKRRLRRLVWHPILNWIAEHHRLVSAILAIIGMTWFVLWLRGQKPKEHKIPEKTYPVTIGIGPTSDIPRRPFPHPGGTH